MAIVGIEWCGLVNCVAIVTIELYGRESVGRHLIFHLCLVKLLQNPVLVNHAHTTLDPSSDTIVKYRHSAVSCVKTARTIEMPFTLWMVNFAA